MNDTEVAGNPTRSGFDDLITPEPTDWKVIADTLAEEIVRLRAEVDRLAKLGGGNDKEPLQSRADHTHPLYPRWLELGYDDLALMRKAWIAVRARRCPACESVLTPLFANSDPDTDLGCDGCDLVFAAPANHFSIDTRERALDRGPDA